MYKTQLIVALDFQDVQQAYDVAKQLKGIVPWVKVGLELFVLGGPKCITILKEMGFKVFLDLKMYDIPNTVHGAVLSACTMGVDLLTIHVQGGERMAKAALKAVSHAMDKDSNNKSRPLIFGVTVLTSMEQGELPLNDGNVGQLVLDLAKKAYAYGLDGVVSSGHEIQAIQNNCGKDFLCLTPGIRPAEQITKQNLDDQRRVMTPRQASQAGAHFLVVGRPITLAQDPAGVAQDIIKEIQSI